MRDLICIYIHIRNRLQAPVLKKGFFIEDTFGQLMLTHLQTLHRKEVRTWVRPPISIHRDHTLTPAQPKKDP